MDINITTDNPLKFLSKSFLHIDTMQHKMEAGQKYKALHDTYGHIGEVQVMIVHRKSLFELSSTVMEIAEGYNDWRILQARRKLMQRQVVFVVILKFLRRSDEQIKKILNKELPKQGVHIMKQPEIFSNHG